MAHNIDVLGVQMDLGAGVRGVDMGPSAVRYAGLIERLGALGLDVRDRSNVVAAVPQSIEPGRARLRYADEIATCCLEIARRVGESFRVGALPLLLGGDHSLAIGALAAARDARPALRVLWLDAHADLNTAETSPSGNVHGTPLAVALGRVGGHFAACGWPDRPIAPDRVALVGLRDLDPGERELIRSLELAVYTIADVDRMGVHAVVSEALDRLAAPPDSLYVSVDLDVVDPLHAPGVGTPVSGGLTVREAHLAMELVADSGRLAGLDLVEVNPIRDIANQTAELARDLALSALGQRIL
ncbi:MAG TPA: arginase [Chloroflexota bacterium]